MAIYSKSYWQARAVCLVRCGGKCEREGCTRGEEYGLECHHKYEPKTAGGRSLSYVLDAQNAITPEYLEMLCRICHDIETDRERRKRYQRRLLPAGDVRTIKTIAVIEVSYGVEEPEIQSNWRRSFTNAQRPTRKPAE